MRHAPAVGAQAAVVSGGELAVLKRAEVLSLSGTVPNTFGQFRTVSGGEPVTIDTLRITLTNRAAPCCANPMGIDNLLLAK